MFFFLFGVLISVYIYFKLIKPCYYWRERGVKHAKSWPGVGSFAKVLFKKEAFIDVAVNLYNKHPDERYVGYMQLTQQCLLIRDIDLIKQISIKDFHHFTDHAFFGQVTSETDLLLSKSLITLSGNKWKNMRATLSPAFTSSKMKNMYLLMDECAENFVQNFNLDVELEMKDVFSKFACNVIASTAFGIQIDSFKNPDNEFYKMGLALAKVTLLQNLKLIYIQLFPKLAEYFQTQVFPQAATTFFRSVVLDNIQKRENEGIVRHDLIHLLMEARKGKLKNENTKEEKSEGFATAEDAETDPTAEQVELTDDHIVAQAMLFFFAGFDTVSTTCSFMAYELAIHPDIQKTLQDEIDSTKQKYNNKIPYEAVLGMKYLDQVVSESLRLWPAGFETDRLCVKDYVIQAIQPDEKAFLVKKGINFILPIMAIQRDPQYYAEPERFDPERFNDENKSKIISGTYMPFGVGPRNCIGSRFALLEVKILFCHLLANFDIAPTAKTEIPLKISPKHFNLQPENGFWLAFKPRKRDF